MDCRQVDTILNEHSLENQSPADKAAFAAHVEACARCAEALRGQEVLTSEAVEPPRPGLYESVRAQALGARVRARRGPGFWLLSGIGVAAAAAVLLVVAMQVLSGGSETAVLPAQVDIMADTPVRDEPPTLEPVTREFVAGVHYEQLATPVPTSTPEGTIEVTEFFMFGCGHCFNLESELSDWSAGLPGDVELVRVPVLWNATARVQAQAFYTAEVLGVADQIIGPVFSAVHGQGRPMASGGEFRSLFSRYGIDGADFDATWASEDVVLRLRLAEELNRLYGINSTPTLIVNGHYLTGPGLAGSYPAVFDIVDVLLEMERAAAERRPVLLPPADSGNGAASQAASIQELINRIRQGQPDSAERLFR